MSVAELPPDVTAAAPPKPPVYSEPIGRSIAASLSSKTGRWVVYILVFLWTIPTFGATWHSRCRGPKRS